MVVLGTVRSLFAYCMVHGAWCKLHAASKIGWKSGGFGYSMKFVCVLCMMRTAYCILCMMHTACSQQNLREKWWFWVLYKVCLCTAWCILHAVSKIEGKSGSFGYFMQFLFVLRMMHTAYWIL